MEFALSRSARHLTRRRPFASRPAASVGRRFYPLHSFRFGRVPIQEKRLTSALGRKSWAADVGNPDLHRPKPRSTQRVAVLLDALGHSGMLLHRQSYSPCLRRRRRMLAPPRRTFVCAVLLYEVSRRTRPATVKAVRRPSAGGAFRPRTARAGDGRMDRRVRQSWSRSQQHDES